VSGGPLECEERALGVDRVEPVEVGLADVEQRLGDEFHAGGGDDDVQAAESFERRREQAVDVFGVGDVRLEGERGPAGLFDRVDGSSAGPWPVA
jgi:hypothetical protein